MELSDSGYPGAQGIAFSIIGLGFIVMHDLSWLVSGFLLTAVRCRSIPFPRAFPSRKILYCTCCTREVIVLGILQACMIVVSISSIILAFLIIRPSRWSVVSWIDKDIYTVGSCVTWNLGTSHGWEAFTYPLKEFKHQHLDLRETALKIQVYHIEQMIVLRSAGAARQEGFTSNRSKGQFNGFPTKSK